MKRFFTLILFSLPCLVVNAQSVTDSVSVKTDSVQLAVAPVSVDSVTALIASAKTDTAQKVAEAVAASENSNTTVLEMPVGAEGNVKQDVTPANELFRRNILKMNVTSLLFNNYNFTYERSLRRKMTFSVGYRFMPKTAFGEVPLFKKAIEIADESGSFDEAEDVDIKAEMNNMFMSNTAYTGELRFYTGKKAGARGFYVSLYGRYTAMQFNYDYAYEGDNQKYEMPISSTIKGYGGGLMFGAQWLIAKRVTFDWHLLGAHYGKISGTADGAADLSDMPQDERRDLEEEIESIGEIGGKRYLEATVTDKGINAKADGPFAGVRAGFSLGIAF